MFLSLDRVECHDPWGVGSKLNIVLLLDLSWTAVLRVYLVSAGNGPGDGRVHPGLGNG
jgi:hypothetical protein